MIQRGAINKIENNTTAFGVSMPEFSIILDESTGTLYELKQSATSSDTLSTVVKEEYITADNTQTVSNKTLTNTDSIGFNTIYSETGGEAVGTVFWDSVNGTLTTKLNNGVKLQNGQELHFYGKFSGDVDDGALCMFNGFQGDHILIKQIGVSDIATIQAQPTRVIGPATSGGLNGEFGYTTWFGYVNDIYTKTPNNLDSADWVQNDILYFSNTTGQLTKTAPVAPERRIEVAAVAKEQTGTSKTGKILVRPTIGTKLEDLDDVDGSDPTTTGDLLTFDATSGTWERGVYNITDYELAFTKNTAFNKNFGTTSGTVLEGSKDALYAKLAENNTFSTKQTISASSGDLLELNGTSTNNTILRFRDDGTEFGAIYGLNDFGELNVRSQGDLNFLAGGAIDRMTITSTGNVGIGTTAPSELQHNLKNSISSPNTLFLENRGTNTTDNTNTYNSSGVMFGTWRDTGKSITAGIWNERAPFASGLSSKGSLVFGAMASGSTGYPTERMRIDGNTGNVGIGTTAPIEKAHISSAGNARLLIQENTGATGSTSEILFLTSATTGFAKGAIIYEDDGTSSARGKLHLCNNNSTLSGNATISDARLTVIQNGNVGIGTTAPADELHINNSTDTSKVRIETGLATGNYTSASLVLKTPTRTSEFVLRGSTGLDIQNAMGIYHNGSFRQVWLDNGNVGIGTTAPSTKIHTYQSGAGAVATFESAGEYTAIKILNSSGGASDWEVRSNDNMNLNAPYNTFSINAGSSYNPALMFQSNLNATFYGNVGIGTTSPGEKLHVNGGIRIGTTANAVAGNIRWNGTKFQGYTGSAWVDFH